MFYYDRGSGPALLLIHGMFGDHLDWEPVLESLAERRRVIAVDLPGFGDSAKPDIDYSASTFTQQIVKLLDELGIERIAVAGNSFGGQIAMALALAHPERVEKLVLVTTGGLHSFREEEIESACERLSEVKLLNFTPAIHEVFFGRIFHMQGSDIQRRYIEKQNAKLARVDYPDYARVLNRCIRLSLSLNLLDHLAALKLPVKLIHGEYDPVVPSQWVRDAAPVFPDAELVLIPECAHIPQLELPQRVIDEIDKFLVHP